MQKKKNGQFLSGIMPRWTHTVLMSTNSSDAPCQIPKIILMYSLSRLFGVAADAIMFEREFPFTAPAQKRKGIGMDNNDLRGPLAQNYLTGTRFDENMSFTLDFPVPVRDRLELLSGLAAGKRILHIGCCDHIPRLAEKIDTGQWLHGRLTEAAAYCVGIDIDAAAVAEARRLSKLANIFAGDITGPEIIPAIGNNVFDYAIFGEVLEHIGNPVSFLSAFLSNYRTNIGQVVITVPSAFRAGNIRNIFRSRETINTDHRFFFTPYTLAKVASDAGLTLASMEMARFSGAGLIKQAILNKFPLLAEDLVFIGSPLD